ncbi:MAG: shikimate kinase [Candidatus Gastranaerophilales bacterium]|nr:shikimate kinase [Candidatus Gastranaerophilales bacterium]
MNISLIGMMGAGKTTISELLANLLNMKFTDIDEEIVKREKMSINDIFELKGEEYFRKVETEVLKEILKSDNQVIATGGGIVKLEQNITLLKSCSKVIYLKADSDILYERIKNNRSRPLLNTSDMKLTINKLLKERQVQYEKADLTIETANMTPAKTAGIILEKLK